MYRIEHGQPDEHAARANPLPIPFQGPGGESAPASARPDLEHLPSSAEEVLDALDDMSRRIDHLARELRCLGWFDENDDGPRAA